MFQGMVSWPCQSEKQKKFGQELFKMTIKVCQTVPASIGRLKKYRYTLDRDWLFCSQSNRSVAD